MIGLSFSKNPEVRLAPSVRGLILLLFVAVVLPACRPNLREERRNANEVILSLGGDPKTLDPGQIVDVISNRATMSILRGLTVLDKDARPQPDLAERWEVSKDGKTYDFYLRDTLWTTGDPVTADDFVYAWTRRNLDPVYASEYAYMLFFIEGAQAYFEAKVLEPEVEPDGVGVEAMGPNQLRVRLNAPAPFFAQLVAHHAFFPVHAATDRADPNWATRADTYVGNGPFRLVEFVPGDHLTAVRHDGYWNAANVAMNQLKFRFIEEETTERIAIETGEVDGTYLAPRPDLEQLRETGMLRMVPLTGTYYVNFNVPVPALADVRVRKALALAIDRQAIVDNVARAGERPALGFVPPALYDVEIEPLFEDARFDEARQLLADAGYPGGAGFPKLKYLYNTLELHRAVAQVLQETWKNELGIEVELENQEFRVVIEHRNQGNFELARNGWVADFADPVNFLDIFLSYSGNNNSHWKNQAYDALIERAKGEPDAERRLSLLREAETLLIESWPIAPLFHYTHPYLCAPELEGYDVTPMDTIDVANLRWKQGEPE